MTQFTVTLYYTTDQTCVAEKHDVDIEDLPKVVNDIKNLIDGFDHNLQIKCLEQ